MRILHGIVALSASLAGCATDGRAAGNDDACLVTGCSEEVCAAQPVFSSCIWHDAYVCFRGAACERQPGGACGWTPTNELTSCLARFPPLPGSPP